MSLHHLTARRTERGSVLLDVMLGMTIFALLIVIGMQNYSTSKQRANLSETEASLMQVVGALNQYVSDNGQLPPSAASGLTYPAGAPASYINAGAGSSLTNLGTLDAKLSPGVSIGRYGVYGAQQGYDANQTYHLCLIHKTGGKIDAWAAWYSPSERIYESGKGAKVDYGTTSCGPVTNLP